MQKVLSLSPEQIDLKGKWLFWSRDPDPVFVRYLQDYGQLEPVLACEEKGEWKLISGYRRVLAARELKVQIQVKALDGVRDLEKGKIYFLSNWNQGRPLYDLVPAARFFALFLGRQKLSTLLLEDFGLNLSKKELARVFSWLELADIWVDFLLQGELNLEAGEYLSRFNSKELEYLRPVIQKLHWSRNNFKKLAEWLFELKKAEDKDLFELLQSLDLSRILEKDLSPKEKTEEILARVKGKRFPELRAMEKKFWDLKKRLCKESHWQIRPEQNFEANALYLSTKIRSTKDLQMVHEELGSLLQKDEIKEMLYLADAFVK